ncbi:hypothetical protein [Pseudomonas sp. GM74]|uniref:hypothetical protein n=1 Tax=Pseudomonas sp. GM74 TaxID=1144336 RepID=UPI0012FC75FA|nr:hypothetical protein [Pseudomonas sp. GM74]
MQVQAKTSEDIQLARVTLLSESSLDFQSLWQVGVGWLPPVAAGNNRPKKPHGHASAQSCPSPAGCGPVLLSSVRTLNLHWKK